MRTIPGFSNYIIYHDGSIWSKSRQHWKIPYERADGYYVVQLWKNGKNYTKYLHRLVLETFVGPCPENMECRHLNGNKSDNYITNLKWGSKKENKADSIKHGKTGKAKAGEQHHNAKLSTEDVLLIRSSYEDGAYSISDLAQYFNVGWSCISQIVKRESWKNKIDGGI